MFDPTLNLDPFLPPVVARKCRRCSDGRLFVETLGDQRRVFCDSCNFAQVYTAKGPMPKVVMREVDKFNRRPGGRPRKVKNETQP